MLSCTATLFVTGTSHMSLYRITQHALSKITHGTQPKENRTYKRDVIKVFSISHMGQQIHVLLKLPPSVFSGLLVHFESSQFFFTKYSPQPRTCHLLKEKIYIYRYIRWLLLITILMSARYHEFSAKHSNVGTPNCR